MISNNKEQYDCSDIDNLYQQYLDNELNAEQKRLFEEHLEYCLPCDKKISFEMKLREYIHSKASNLKFDETPEFNLEKILNRPS